MFHLLKTVMFLHQTVAAGGLAKTVMVIRFLDMLAVMVIIFFVEPESIMEDTAILVKYVVNCAQLQICRS